MFSWPSYQVSSHLCVLTWSRKFTVKHLCKYILRDWVNMRLSLCFSSFPFKRYLKFEQKNSVLMTSHHRDPTRVWLVAARGRMMTDALDLKALANGDTLLRTHWCRHKCFPVCPRAQHLLRTQILCPGHKKCFWFCSETFCVRNKCFLVCAAQETSWATMCP